MSKCEKCGNITTGTSRHKCVNGEEKENDDSGDFLTSAVIGAVTDNAIVGGLLGGDMLGGIIGDIFSDGDLF